MPLNRFMHVRLSCAAALLACLCGAQTTPTTPNLNLYLPNANNVNWNVPLDANFTSLDLYLSGGLSLPGLWLQPLVPGVNPTSGLKLFVSTSDGLLHTLNASGVNQVIQGAPTGASGIFAILSGSGSAVIAPNATGAGSGGTAVCASNYGCSGLAGSVTVVTAGTPAVGAIFTVTYPSAFTGNYPSCLVTTPDGSVNLTTLRWSDASLTTLTVSTANPALNVGTYNYRYHCTHGN
jgi:hypothetical protein